MKVKICFFLIVNQSSRFVQSKISNNILGDFKMWRSEIHFIRIGREIFLEGQRLYRHTASGAPGSVCPPPGPLRPSPALSGTTVLEGCAAAPSDLRRLQSLSPGDGLPGGGYFPQES